MKTHCDGPSRRHWLQAVLTGALALPAAARAQAVMPHLGIVSLLGDSVRVVAREISEVLFKDVGLDEIASRTAQAAVQQRDPQAQVSLHRPPAPLAVDEQRAIATAAAERGVWPDWLLQTVRDASLSHVLLIASNVGAMEFLTGRNQVVGTGRVAGVGFYVSADGRTVSQTTGAVSTGYLAPFVQLRLLLLDASSRKLVNSVNLSQGYVVGSRSDEGPDPWRFLTRDEKARALQRLLHNNIERGMASLLKTA